VTGAGAAQSAYRLTAAERLEDLDDPARLVWDTGRRVSDQTLHVAWDGPVLRSGTRYHWRVEVWDETGAPAGRAESWFETGLLHGGDWAAVWIGRDPLRLPPVDPPQDDHANPIGSVLYLRRDFIVDSAPVRARLYATARGIYEPRLNGGRVGDHELAPGWTEYHRRIQYQTYDVTDQVRPGANCLAAIVADGWWSGYVGFDPRRPAHHYGDQTAFLAQLVLEFADGSRRVLATDATWTEGTGAIQTADLLMGQHVDGRRANPGWDGPGGPSEAFRPVRVLDTTPGPLVAEPDQPVRVVTELPAVAVDRRGPQRFIVDFGQNLVGRVRLAVRGAGRGRRIVLRHAEILSEGELYVDNLRRAAATDVYTASGDGDEVFEPQFTFHGFRYVEVDNFPGELSLADVTARVLHSDTPWTGEFECSDAMVNQLQSNITWGQRGNFVAVPTDCPQRDERLGWLADAQIFAPTATRNADVSAFFARWMRDVVDGQDGDGRFRDVAPVVTLLREGAPAWGDGGVIIPWQLWRTYGDRRVLERSYEAMRAWVDHIRRHNPDLRWRHRTGNSYGDWLQFDVTTPAMCWPRRTSRAAPRSWPRPRRSSAASPTRPGTGRCTAPSGPRSSSPTSARTAPSRAVPRRVPARAGVRAAARAAGAGGGRAPRRRHREARLPPDDRVRRRGAVVSRAVRARPGRSGVRAVAPGGLPVVGVLDPARCDHDLGALGRLDGTRRVPVRHHELVQPLQPGQRRRLALRPGRRDRPDARLGGVPRTSAAPDARTSACPGPGPAGDRPRHCRLWMVRCRWSVHRGGHGATRQHRRTGDPHAGAGQRARERRARCRPAGGSRGRAERRRGHPAAFVRPLHRQRHRNWRCNEPTRCYCPLLAGDTMKIHRLPALAAAVTLVTALTACSGGTNANNGGGGSQTLTVASVDQGSIEDVVKAFEAANPGVTVNLTTAGADQYQQQIRTQLASGTAPDVFTVWPGNGNPGAVYTLAKPGYLLDLSDQPWAGSCPPASRASPSTRARPTTPSSASTASAPSTTRTRSPRPD
jgi:hypothetical protein